MKRMWLLVVFFCIVHKKSGDVVVQYEGMDAETVTKLIQQTYAVPFEFISKERYDAFVVAHDEPLLSPRK